MKVFLFFSFVLLFFAATNSLAQTNSLRGKVTDAKSKLPIDYASIALFKTGDSVLVAGSITKQNGWFKLDKITPGSYRLKITFLGYDTKYLKDIAVINGSLVNLGNIPLTPSGKLLNEVTVSGQKITALNKIDKQSYKAGQFESAKGGSAIDVLKNLPSVSVNEGGDITVRGSGGFLVLINGKPVLADAQTVLSQLPANAVDNIELITAPSAKYDPDGRGGIINIITKKGVNDGFTLIANTQGGIPAITTYGNLEKPVRFGADATINYKKGKWDISAGANYTRNDNAGYREGYVYTKNFDNNTITRFPSNGERSFNRYNYAARASVNYTADLNNVIAMGFYSGKRYQSRLADLLYNNTTSNLTSNALIKSTTYYNSNQQTKEGTFNLGNFDYTHTFPNKSFLTAGLLYEHDNLYGATQNRNLKYPNTADTIQYVNNPYKRPISAYRFKLDYSVNIGKGKLESGYQLRSDTQNGTFDYFVSPATTQPDAARFRGSTHAKNVINSIYSQYSGKVARMEYTGGLRYEYAARTVNLSYDPNPHTLNLSNLFPSANLLYSINNGLKLKAGYSRRVQRTTNLELNPIPEREHSETLEEGDPDLLPEFIDLAELGLTHNFTKGSFFATAYYQHIQNPIQRLNSVYADTILNRVYSNAGSARLFGLEAGTNLSPFKWCTIYIGANLYNYKIEGNIAILNTPVNILNTSWAYSINGNTGFQLNKTLSLQANVNYLSKRPTAQGHDGSFFAPNTSVKKTFMNGRLSASLLWQNMNMGFLGANKQRITTSGSDFYTTTNYISETDVFLINLSFNLNKFTAKSKLPTSEVGDKEF
ncbi:outer membrane beta-barrel family protein [Mucilaginibacter sp. FT3.2]|uniref:outer membrane beta-barrel family protein n=1 Tax=Mucilaginibacter sp. FT3.2 TaxID=2723090 RepID=UPI00161504A6|nr:outer membrane beta-barrel family protein [Mucilaginibacter sp. FT3.2]MBB6233771.1 outer membrane receptor protein involved in Fe transport [Mucilaginibacter sp. FT3.2]